MSAEDGNLSHKQFTSSSLQNKRSHTVSLPLPAEEQTKDIHGRVLSLLRKMRSYILSDAMLVTPGMGL